MYVDLTVEGTPEEVAAFKHIDAALAARTKPKQKAITAGPAKRSHRARHHSAAALAQRRAVREWANRAGYAVAPRGIISAAIMTAYQEAHQ
jgi:hypothetical protein